MSTHPFVKRGLTNQSINPIGGIKYTGITEIHQISNPANQQVRDTLIIYTLLTGHCCMKEAATIQR